MSTITFAQTTTASGQIALTLSSVDLPSSFAFNMVFNYSGNNVLFNKVIFPGTSSASINGSYAGGIGTVSMSGALVPSSGSAFATILFDANGLGAFNADIVTLKLNGIAANFTDPAAFNFSILGESASLTMGGFASGTYMPLENFFPAKYTVKTAPAHGSVTFGEAGNQAAWKYTPAAGFYGADQFALRVSDTFDTKEKSILVNVSPVGTAGNDTFLSSSATYRVDGGKGIDAIQYEGKLSNFTVAKTSTGFVVTDKTGVEGTNYLDNFERLKFSDGTVALDINGSGGQAYRVYQAAFNRTPDAAGLGYWIDAMDKGASLVSVADGFMHSSEFMGIYGAAPSNAALVSKFYENILHRQPEKAGADYWVGVLDSHGASPASVLANISESAENQAALAAIIGSGFAYLPYGA